MSRMRSTLLSVIVAAAFAVGCAPTPGPVPAVEYANMPAGGEIGVWGCSGDAYQVAQAFTAPFSGQIDRVSLVVLREDSPPDRLGVIIVPLTKYGWPDDRPQLGSGAYEGNGSESLGEFVDIPLSTPAQVTADQSYAVLLSSGSSSCPPPGKWRIGTDTAAYGSGIDPFPGGKLWTRTLPNGSWSYSTVTDLLFRIWMN